MWHYPEKALHVFVQKRAPHLHNKHRISTHSGRRGSSLWPNANSCCCFVCLISVVFIVCRYCNLCLLFFFRCARPTPETCTFPSRPASPSSSAAPSSGAKDDFPSSRTSIKRRRCVSAPFKSNSELLHCYSTQTLSKGRGKASQLV